MRYKKLSTPIIKKKLDKGVVAEANLDGSMFIDSSVKKGSKLEKKAIVHEEHHLKQFDEDILHYNDFNVTWKGQLYKRQDGMIEYNGKFYPEGHNIFPWEQEAVKAEDPYSLVGFNTDEFKKAKPPRDDSFDTAQEIKELQRIVIDKTFAIKHDDIPKAFSEVARKNNVKDFDNTIAEDLARESVSVILDLKNYFKRPRPAVVAEKMNLDLKIIDLASARTMSYPSGHSAQAFLIARVLGDKYPKARNAFNKLAKKISYSRRVAHLHYKSDSKFGEAIGRALYKHIKQKK